MGREREVGGREEEGGGCLYALLVDGLSQEEKRLGGVLRGVRGGVKRGVEWFMGGDVFAIGCGWKRVHFCSL
jgi:hypothetical protein